MTRSVVTVEPVASVKRAAALLAANGFTALPVVDPDGDLVGVVTESDVVRGRIPPDARWRIWADEAQGTPDPATTVGEVMTSPALSAAATEDAVQLVRRMIDGKLRSMPVVDGDRLVGIVTRRDLVRVIGRDDALIAADVRRRLEAFGGWQRWRVRCRDGLVTITDEFQDPAEHHIAEVLARAVPGVCGVTVGHGSRAAPGGATRARH